MPQLAFFRSQRASDQMKAVYILAMYATIFPACFANVNVPLNQRAELVSTSQVPTTTLYRILRAHGEMS
jgi:hypothetical protein